MKVAISGAGIAGPALAFWLHRAGHEAVLIERAPHFRTGGYVIDFWGVGYTVAEKMGILPEVRAAGYQVGEVRMVNARGRRVGGFKVDGMRELVGDRFTSLRRGDLAAIIYKQIEGRVETIFGETITAIEELSTGVRVSFERSAPREFDLVFGADGLHSAVREIAFGPESQFEKRLGYHIAILDIPGYRPRDELVYMMYGIPGKQVSRFSMRDDRTLCMFAYVDEAMSGPEPRDAAARKALLHRLFDDAGWESAQILKAMDQVEDVYFDRVSQIVLPSWSNGRVALVGDAAACVSLMAGEGTGLALTEAYILAGELTCGDYGEAFRRYEERLRPFIEQKQKRARQFASSFAPRTHFGIWARNLLSRLFAIPFVTRFFIGRDLSEDFEIPHYPALEASAKAACLG